MNQFFLAVVLVAAWGQAVADNTAAEPLPRIADYTEGFSHQAGFLDSYWDPATGKALLKISQPDQDAIYVNSLPAGLGSNDIGLDRGQLGDTRYVVFKRVGRTVLMREPNQRFRATSANPDEVKAVEDAFAQSVLAAFPVVAEDGPAFLVDVTSLLLTDAHRVANRLKATSQGDFTLDAKRSLALPEHFKNFPDNTVLEALLTLTSSKPGPLVEKVTPTGGAVTLRMRHEFVKAPTGYMPRRHHPRSGFFTGQETDDLAAPLDASVRQVNIVRHRLEPVPGQPGSAREPIVYYVDRGAPEPIRSALLEGASWWSDAFEAAGWRNAYRVEILPEGVDPMDARYNVIQWVHRAERGWSYGYGVIDPRNGEMIKGHVTLGSRRVRQDMLIFEALLNDTTAPEVQQAALARLRQLSAHEVGHTLGIVHNFAASMDGDQSVMDYPHPNVRLAADGSVDLSQAYATGVGEWDRYAVNYGYRWLENEEQGLAEIVRGGRSLSFAPDAYARSPRNAHPRAHLWDNGGDVIQRMEELMAIRELALGRLSASSLRPYEATSDLERKLVPMYLLHRYQVDAVAKLVGGYSFDFALAGEVAPPYQPVAPDRQQQALELLLSTLSTGQLTLSQRLLALLPPPVYGHPRDRETFTHPSGNVFDPAAPARSLTQLVMNALLHPQRLARLAGANQGPDTSSLLDSLLEATLLSREGGYVAHARNWVVLAHLMRTASNAELPGEVRAPVWAALQDLARELDRRAKRDAVGYQSAAAELARFLKDPDPKKVPAAAAVPPGSPI
ncbi:MAG: zinc-dependent metalloprotease [Xanthomonadales bacterium]|nr:zinc-dependent metalloprotease [Xanthomonadales bacterium]